MRPSTSVDRTSRAASTQDMSAINPGAPYAEPTPIVPVLELFSLEGQNVLITGATRGASAPCCSCDFPVGGGMEHGAEPGNRVARRGTGDASMRARRDTRNGRRRPSPPVPRQVAVRTCPLPFHLPRVALLNISLMLLPRLTISVPQASAKPAPSRSHRPARTSASCSAPARPPLRRTTPSRPSGGVSPSSRRTSLTQAPSRPCSRAHSTRWAARYMSSSTVAASSSRHPRWTSRRTIGTRCAAILYSTGRAEPGADVLSVSIHCWGVL